ncbi:MAG: Npt1/Npt2 family nucleotide transporter [Myxococcales bacterium]|nr:Npt1/Npt2 family nucleotide transporter [Myxococcales bacterium]
MNHPLKAILDIRREELPQALMMFLYFLLVITTFWILKPIKKALFISHYKEAGGFHFGSLSFDAAQAELLAKTLNMFVALAATMAFGALSNRFHRHQLTNIFAAFFIAGFVVYTGLLHAPASGTVWTFYLFGDLFSTIMVATFFAFLNDTVDADAAKRTYGLVVLGGVAGGVLGSNVVRSLIDTLSRTSWLWICIGVNLAIMLIATIVGRRFDRDATSSDARLRDGSGTAPSPQSAQLAPARNPALEGARLVLRSRYLMSIVAIVGIYEMVSTIMDFQFSATIANYCEGPEIGRQISLAFAVMNTTAFAVQLLLTSFVMRRFGAAVALMVLPVATALGSAAFLALPVLAIGRLIPTFDGALAYSINQSAKEALYVPTTRDEKYKAKAFIDMFVQRLAKALAVGLSLIMTSVVTDFSGVRWLSLATLVLIAVWTTAARYAGRHFDDAR